MGQDNPYASFSREELMSRLQIAESTVAEQRKLLHAKDSIIQKYVQEFAQLTTDYEKLVNTRYDAAVSDQPANSPFSNQIEGVTQLPVLPPLEHPRRQLQGIDSNQDVDPDPLPGRRALRSQINFAGDDGPPPPKKLPNLPRTAMNDRLNDHFGYPPEPTPDIEPRTPNTAYPPVVVDVSGMNVDQMRTKVDELNLERSELERQLNKVMPKGKVMSYMIREREELESHFNDVCRAIGQIKLEIRRRDK
jgi:hypothetical protein